MGRRGGMGGGPWGGGGWGGNRGGMGRGGGGYASHPDGKKVLQQIARETGGGYFEYSKKKSVGDIYAQIEQELRNQYSLGYTPDQPGPAGEYRKISVSVRDKKNVIVQAREGYYVRHA
jgi:VWFA-related protein